MTVLNLPGAFSKSDSDSDSDNSSLFDSAPSSPTSSTALKEEHKLKKPPATNTKEQYEYSYQNTIEANRSSEPVRSVSLLKPQNPRKKIEQQRRYSLTSADLRLPPGKLNAQKESTRLESRERTLSARKPSSGSVPRAANWQMPPHIHTQRRMHSSAPSRSSTLRKSKEELDPANVLKLKISCRESLEEIVALKLRKDRLRSTSELVDVILFKLAGKLPCSKDGVKIALVFPDSTLPGVTLKSPGGRSNNCECEDFMMGYIQAKSKIYVRVSSGK
ncbi:uncharacterized protein CXQ87_002366 [Candidozyma duobushaemuli]|uniref:Uncharacterized protein n=1 Tax=Candidozyma duobushaemuli TaxID=1231522 RepID=A0A2V1A861_9ASCO|nr:uncharacterized protein CXQ87_002366 [[Candida] duobushaemulonis]PVH14239.1 hypothetical protein CXQ87_002366 [[Candida] duobushaemulonis]